MIYLCDETKQFAIWLFLNRSRLQIYYKPFCLWEMSRHDTDDHIHNFENCRWLANDLFYVWYGKVAVKCEMTYLCMKHLNSIIYK